MPETDPNVYGTFTHTCQTCGSTVHVVDTVTQPHRCRIEIPGPQFEWPEYGEGYWERGEGSNYVAYGDDPGWDPTARVLKWHQPGGRLLEVACSKGWFVRAAVQHGYDAHGIDLSQHAIGHPAPGIGDRLTLGNAISLPYTSQQYDVVCSWEFLEHVPEQFLLVVLEEMDRVAAPGALIVHRIGTLDDEGALHDHMHDETHVTNKPYAWWYDLIERVQPGWRPQPEIVIEFDRMFAGRDWAGRYVAYRKV